MNTLYLCLSLFVCLVPHGELHQKIRRLDDEIVARPKVAELRIRRGELHRLHADFVLALKDFDAALKIDPETDSAHYFKALVYYQKTDDRQAAFSARKFLAQKPKHLEGLRLFARIVARQGRHKEAVAAFARLIKLPGRKRPDDYLGQARSLAAMGDAGQTLAIVALTRGIAKLGSCMVLELEALNLERGLKRWPQALRRVDRLMATSRRKEEWFLRKAEILTVAGRNAAALKSLANAEAALVALPRRWQARSKSSR